MSKSLGSALLLGLLASAQTSEAVVIGAPAIDRLSSDSYSDFSMLLLSNVIPSGGGGLHGWETFAADPGTMALLFLEDLGGNTYRTKFVDAQTVTTGLNTFSTTGALEAGWIMGIWMGTASVDFTYGSPQNTTYTTNAALTAAPNVGDVISYTGTLTQRTYSINASVPDGGSTVALLGLAVTGIAGVRKKFFAA